MTPVGNPQIAREYLRVSYDRSGRERSPEEQHGDNQRAADARGWALGQPYRDKGSASRYATKVRQDFERLVTDLEQGAFDANVLILWESSRGARRMSEWVRLIELCEERSVRIFVTSDGKIYDPADPRDRRSLLEDGVDAEFESAKTSKRSTRAAAATAAAGMPNGSINYGYRRVYDKATRRFVAQVPEPEEAKVIKELFDRLHKGHTLRSIQQDFESRGIRSRSGKVIGRQGLRSIAMRRAYIGEREHTPGRHRGQPGETTITKAVWPPLVSRTKFLAVQRILTAPERKVSRPGRAVHLLSMIAKCDTCSGPIAARSAKNRSDEIQYHCHRGGHLRIPYYDLNAYAERVMIAYLQRPDNVERLTANEGGSERLEAVREEIINIRGELDDLADQVGRGDLSATLAARAEPAIRTRLRDAEAREMEMSTPSILRGLISPGADVARRWKATPMEVKREIARILLAPNVIGELRVTKSAKPGQRLPVEDRVVWRREDAVVS